MSSKYLQSSVHNDSVNLHINRIQIDSPGTMYGAVAGEPGQLFPSAVFSFQTLSSETNTVAVTVPYRMYVTDVVVIPRETGGLPGDTIAVRNHTTGDAITNSMSLDGVVDKHIIRPTTLAYGVGVYQGEGLSVYAVDGGSSTVPACTVYVHALLGDSPPL